MLPQEVRTVKQVVEDYKKFNHNTVKRVIGEVLITMLRNYIK